MADRKPVEDKTERIVRPKPGGGAKASNVKPVKTRKRTGRGRAYRAKIEAMLAELASEQLVDVWQRVYPFAIASEFDLPNRQGIIQDLADFAVVLQPDLEGITADQLCRRVEKYGGAANREKNSLSMRPKVQRVKLPASSSSRTSTSALSKAVARTPR